jgi:hypothetical protein
MKCKLVEIEGRPGFQWCPVCQRPRGWPKGQRNPAPMPERYNRECVAGEPIAPIGEPKSRGFGDTVAKAIKVATGGLVKPCGGCKKRQQKLNELFPYADRADEEGGRSG